MEFFSDLYAASYAGRAYSAFLADFAGNDLASETHPATTDRLDNIYDLLSGRTNEIIEMFQSTLTVQDLPPLKIQYSAPVVAGAFDNVRPYPIASDSEVHGILEAGYLYLVEALKLIKEPWVRMSEGDVEAIVNDLVEKSIRNRMVVARWDTTNLEG